MNFGKKPENKEFEKKVTSSWKLFISLQVNFLKSLPQLESWKKFLNKIILETK